MRCFPTKPSASAILLDKQKLVVFFLSSHFFSSPRAGIFFVSLNLWMKRSRSPALEGPLWEDLTSSVQAVVGGFSWSAVDSVGPALVTELIVATLRQHCEQEREDLEALHERFLDALRRRQEAISRSVKQEDRRLLHSEIIAAVNDANKQPEGFVFDRNTAVLHEDWYTDRFPSEKLGVLEPTSVDFFINAAEYWQDLRQCMAQAERHICVTDWDFNHMLELVPGEGMLLDFWDALLRENTELIIVLALWEG